MVSEIEFEHGGTESVVPVGSTNRAHMPTEFFGVFRPVGDATIIPCTWHETGLSIWGKIGAWRYEAMVVPGLDSDRFGRENWVQTGSGSRLPTLLPEWPTLTGTACRVCALALADM